MEAVRRHAVVDKDGQVRIDGLPYKKGDKIEVILLKEKRGGRPHGGMTARELVNSPLVGIWADREDITDSSEFARRLRERAEHRQDR